MKCLKCCLYESCTNIYLNTDKKNFHYFNQIIYWQGFSPITVIDNMVLRPYMYKKLRILGYMDLKNLLALRYKTQEYQRYFL